MGPVKGKKAEQDEQEVNELVELLRNATPEELKSSGLVDEPGFWGGVTGWHAVKHIMTPGLGNKTEGICDIGGRVGTAVLGVLYALEKIR